MGIIQRGSGKRPHHIDVEYQDRLDNEIQDCMKCRYFWGNNSRCISQKCFTERMPDKSDQRSSGIETAKVVRTDRNKIIVFLV